MNESTAGFYPPYGHTGVEVAPAHLSWFAGSAVTDSDADLGRDLSARLRALFPVGTSQGHTSHYAKGHRADDWSWGVYWSGLGSARGTVYAEVRQGIWEGLADADAAALAATLTATVRPSRIDLAVDLRGGPPPRWYWDRRALAESRTHRAGWSYTENGAGWQKVTVGARSSTRYLRVYTAASHAGSTRHELELKAETARAIAPSLGEWRDALPSGFAAEYGRLVRWH